MKSNWPVVRLGSVVSTLVPQRDKPDPLDGPIPWVRIEDFDGQDLHGSKTGQGVTAAQVKSMNLRIFPPGTVLCSCSCSMGAVAVARTPLVSNQTFIGLVPGREIDSRFLFYLMSSMQDDLQAQATGAIQQYLSQEDFRSMRIPLPALDEQRRIADLLDSELDSLDGISAARRKQLELLDERWDVQARCLVGGVVDSSGDSPADSSLAWLGPVNKSWASVAIGRISTTYTGTTFPHEFQGEADGDYPFVKVADFSLADDSGTLGVAKNWVTKSVARRLRARIVPEGAILYARVGAAMLLNQRRLVLREIIVDDNVRGLLFREGISRYWLYVLSFLDMGQLANPGPVPSVSEAQVSAVRVPFPPMEEQLRIVRELDSLAACHRQASSVLTRQLKLLAERRKSLIAAVVTGQVDVTTARGAKT